MSALLLLFTVGTFYESAQGRQAAQEIIYQSVFMTVLTALLALNIIAVMIDRYPWKKKHIGFLMAHFGILFVIAGALMTRLYGVDGHLRLKIGETGARLMTSSVLFTVYSSFDGKNLTELYKKRLKFFSKPPDPKKPLKVNLGSELLKISDFYPFALGRVTYQRAKKGGPALRFQIEGSRAGMVRWLFKSPWTDKAELDLGPARIVLLSSLAKNFKNRAVDRPTLFLAPEGAGLKYELRRPGAKKAPSKNASKLLKREAFVGNKEGSEASGQSVVSSSGFLKKGSVLKTGWMDFQFRLLEYLPKALPHTIFTPQKKPSDRAVPAIQVEFKGEKKWMGLNSRMFFFDESKVYVPAYLNESKSLGFFLKLKDFKVIRYPSSFKAMSYESQVTVGDEEYKISMNHPLKISGYTIYQAGFEEDETGKPVASVFSINKDPGRFVKYFGSFLIVLGSFILFLRRNLRARQKTKRSAVPVK